MKLNKIIDKIKFEGSFDNREITHIAHDSRKVKNGTLFIAIAGKIMMDMILFLMH